jgi:hypothetical protein
MSEEPIPASDVSLDCTKIDTLRAEESRLRAEMMKVSRSRVAGSKLAARQSALRTALRSVERERQAAERTELDRQRQVRADLGEWPSPSAAGDELAGPDYWPGPDDPFAALDAGDTRALRDGWRKAVDGDPPWASVA